MIVVRLAIAVLLAVAAVQAATFGTVVSVVGGAADLVLDESRARLYLVNTSQTRIDVYSTRSRERITSVRTEAQPLAAALSRDRRFLYVTAHEASAINIIDLDTLEIANRVNLPARPEGIAVGGDGKVLISTIGTGQNNASNVLLIYDPEAESARSVVAVPVTPAPPQNPLVPSQTGGRPFLASRSQLVTSGDGSLIIGVNIPTNTSRAVFVYEVASGTVLRSRTVANPSSVLTVSPDGKKFMAGLTLFETDTLQILAQQNAANSPWPFPNGTNFNSQTTQGGSVFTPDGAVLFSAFNIAPVQNPPARANVSQLMLNDPDNLLIRLGLQMPENLFGKMVISADGGTLYALSESGFVVIPVGTAQQNPIAMADNTVSLLVNDACGVFSERRNSNLDIRNAGRGRLNVQAQLLQTTPTGPGGLGGVGGPGGGAPGGGVIIVVPGAPGGITIPTAPTLPGGFPTPANPAVAAGAPTFRTQPTVDGARLDLGFTSAAIAQNPGTVSPTHTLLLQSNEAINIPPAVRVFQNYRDPEAKGEVVPVPVGLSANEALEDMVLDSFRQRIYIANSGLNRVEVYDIRRRELLPPIKVGQMPRSLALTPDGSTLYVANSGGESISIVDPERMVATGRVKFPPLPVNSSAALITPSIIAAGQRGLMIIMNNGSLWRVVGDEAVPRPTSATIGTATLQPPRTMAATPNGEYILVLAGNGFAYLYDSAADEFVQGRQVFTNPITGYYGPVAAGPRGEYYLANGLILNEALSVRPGQTPTATNRPISAVGIGSGSTFVRMTQPIRANANTIPAERPQVEMVDANTGLVTRAGLALESPISTLVGTGRLNINGRTMAVDGTGTIYALTTSGLSVVPLDPPALADRPAMNPNGAVSLTSYLPAFAPGSLISIFGRNLAGDGVIGGATAPTLMGGVCVTMNNQPLPLLMTSPSQINAQIPTSAAPGRYTLTVRSIDRSTASFAQPITVARYAPGVFTDPDTKEALVFRPDGSRVTKSSPAKRDEPLMMFATGLGATKGGRLNPGQPAPSSPLAESDEISLYFGDPRWSQAEIIVDWSGLVPGLIGVYQINLRIPGDHMKGPELPVTLRIGGSESQKTGPVVPTIAVQ